MPHAGHGSRYLPTDREILSATSAEEPTLEPDNVIITVSDSTLCNHTISALPRPSVENGGDGV